MAVPGSLLARRVTEELGSQLVPGPVTSRIVRFNTPPVIFLCTLLMEGSQVVCCTFSVALANYCLGNKVIHTSVLF